MATHSCTLAHVRGAPFCVRWARNHNVRAARSRAASERAMRSRARHLAVRAVRVRRRHAEHEPHVTQLDERRQRGGASRAARSAVLVACERGARGARPELQREQRTTARGGGRRRRGSSRAAGGAKGDSLEGPASRAPPLRSHAPPPPSSQERRPTFPELLCAVGRNPRPSDPPQGASSPPHKQPEVSSPPGVVVCRLKFRTISPPV